RQIAEMRALIQSLAGRHTILVTSHVLAEVERVADRAAILLRGRLLAVHRIRRGGPGSRLRVVVRAGQEGLMACGTPVPGVTSAVVTDPGERRDAAAAIVEVQGPEVAERLAASLAARAVPLLELAEAPADLESVFLALTGTSPVA